MNYVSKFIIQLYGFSNSTGIDYKGLGWYKEMTRSEKFDYEKAPLVRCIDCVERKKCKRITKNSNKFKKRECRFFVIDLDKQSKYYAKRK